MQDVVIEKPYQFIPPYRGRWWSWLIRTFNLHAIWLKRQGITSYECRHAERLQASLRAGHGILLAPNHCRAPDPIVMGWLARTCRCDFYAMASWHLYHQSRFMAWSIRRMGGFSVYREGVDRQAINTAIDSLVEARRPLIIFPEGGVTRTNDRVQALLDGVAFIARAAAKRRQKQDSHAKVVVHPVALKYRLQDDLATAVDPVLTEIEHRLTWRPQRHVPLIQRIAKVGWALLTLKEIEYFERTFQEPLADRIQRMIDRLLVPLEQEWIGQQQTGGVVPRVKALRMKILPEMVEQRVDSKERERRWLQLAEIYLAQQIASYPPDYLSSRFSVDRLYETVERFEEDLTDKIRPHGRLRVIIEVGQPIEVSPVRDKKATTDPLMASIGSQLQAMLDGLAEESPLWEDV